MHLSELAVLQGLYAEIQDEIKDPEVKAGAVVMESGSQRRAQETLLRKLLLAQRRSFERVIACLSSDDERRLRV